MIEKIYNTPISNEYLKICPNDVFGNYIRSLELAGLTEENLLAAGLLKEIEKRKNKKAM